MMSSNVLAGPLRGYVLEGGQHPWKSPVILQGASHVVAGNGSESLEHEVLGVRVIHLVRGLPPKISRDKKTITITFPDRFPVRTSLLSRS